MPLGSQLIARDTELSAVARFFDTLPPGSAGLLLAGEVGIGKSTLWTAARDIALSRSFTVLTCRCAQSEMKLSFSALGDLLGSVLDSGVLRLPSPQGRALDVALLRTEPAGDVPDMRAVCLAALTAIRQLCSSARVVVAIDDIQWLDSGTAAVLDFALRRLGDEAVAVLASVRLEDNAPTLVLDLDQLLPGRLTRVAVGPLPFGAIMKILWVQAGGSFSRPLAWRIFQACGGNPFYALELARELQTREAEPAAGEPLPVPASLTALVATRLDGLPHAVRYLLLLTAATPYPTVTLLSRAFRDRPVVRMLQPALDRRIVEISGEVIRFAHPLWASAAYSAAEAGTRQQVHRRLAAVCGNAEERARHLALAAGQPSELAAAALSDAADVARKRGAARSAAEYASMAARLTPDVDKRWRRRIAAAEYLFHAGDAVGAGKLLEELVAEIPPGPVRARARAALGRIRMYDAGNQAAIDALTSALADALSEPELQAEIHLTMAWICDFDLSEGLRHADEAIGILTGAGAEAVPDADLSAQARALLAGALGAKLWLGFLLGQGLRMDLAERAGDLEAHAPLSRAVDGVELPLGALLKSADRLDAAREKLAGVHAAAVRQQDDSSRFEVVLELGYLECLTGRWPLARQYAQDAAEFAELTGQEELRPAVLSLAGLVDALQGQLEQARAGASEGLRLAEESRATWFTLMLMPVLGFIELSANHPAAAVGYLARADDLCERIGLREPGRFRFHADYVEALITRGEFARAAVVLDRFEERGQALQRPWALATAARCRAMLLAAHGDLLAAVDQAEAALSRHEQLPIPFELGRTLLTCGQIRRRARQKKEARDMLSRAEQVFGSLGAQAWLARAHDGLGRLGIRPPAALTLTVTERQVAELAAAGLTNREISERMFISLRTTESNLSRVYRKLGIRSRAELARDFAGHVRSV